MDFFFKVLFLFSLTNQAVKIGLPGPKFSTVQVGFFFFFSENGKKLSK